MALFRSESVSSLVRVASLVFVLAVVGVSSVWAVDLPAPTLYGPGNSMTGITTSPSFSWSTVAGADFGYFLAVATSSSALPTDPTASTCAGCVRMEAVSGTSFAASGLSAGTTYYWKVRARGPGATYGNWTSAWYFTTAAGGGGTLPAPTLYGPGNGTTGITTSPGFSWSAVSGADFGYYLAVATSSSALPTDPMASTCAGCVRMEAVSGTSFVASGLSAGTTYYWKVRARGPGATYGNWGSPWSFATAAAGGGGNLPAPALYSPTNGLTGVSTSPSFSWSAVSGADFGYYLAVATSTSALPTGPAASTCAGCVKMVPVTGTSYAASGLSAGTTYYWKVRARGPGSVYGNWASPWNFSTAAGGGNLAAPSLFSPSDGLTGVSTSPSFSWSPVSGASNGYFLAVATSPSALPTDPTASTCAGCVSMAAVSGTSYTASGLSGRTTYYWKVRARGPGSTYGNWASPWSFATKLDKDLEVVSFVIEPENYNCGGASLCQGERSIFQIGIRNNGVTTYSGAVDLMILAEDLTGNCFPLGRNVEVFVPPTQPVYLTIGPGATVYSPFASFVTSQCTTQLTAYMLPKDITDQDLSNNQRSETVVVSPNDDAARACISLIVSGTVGMAARAVPTDTGWQLMEKVGTFPIHSLTNLLLFRDRDESIKQIAMESPEFYFNYFTQVEKWPASVAARSWVEVAKGISLGANFVKCYDMYIPYKNMMNDMMGSYVNVLKRVGDKLAFIFAECPVNVQITDSQGKKVACMNDGSIVQEMQPSIAFFTGPNSEHKLIAVVGNDTYRTEVTGTDFGSMNLSYQNGPTSYSFNNVEVGPQTVANVTVDEGSSTPSLAIDSDGDGTANSTMDGIARTGLSTGKILISSYTRSASKLDRRLVDLRITGTLRLGKDTDGISPRDPTTIKIGDYARAIKSFRQSSPTSLTFTASPARRGVHKVTLQKLTARTWGFVVKATGLNRTQATKVPNLYLRIGNDLAR